MHVAVSNLSPVNIQICNKSERNIVSRKPHHCTGIFPLPSEILGCVMGCEWLDLDAGIAKELQCRSDVGLQLILHSSHTQQLHLPLQTFNHRSNLQSSVMQAQLRLIITTLQRHRAAIKENVITKPLT